MRSQKKNAAQRAPGQGPAKSDVIKNALKSTGTGLLTCCLAILAVTFLLRALTALLEALAVLAIAAVVAGLYAMRQWPDNLADTLRSLRHEIGCWLAAMLDHMPAQPPPQDRDNDDRASEHVKD